MNREKSVEKMCECGEIVRGINDNHMTYTMRIHKTSKHHRERMNFKKAG